MCANTIPRMKDISNDLREAAIAANQSGKGYKPKQFGVYHSTMLPLKIFKTADNLARSGHHSMWEEGGWCMPLNTVITNHTMSSRPALLWNLGSSCVGFNYFIVALISMCTV